MGSEMCIRDSFEIIRKMGVKKVYTPKDYDLNTIISDMSDFVEQSAA